MLCSDGTDTSRWCSGAFLTHFQSFVLETTKGPVDHGIAFYEALLYPGGIILVDRDAIFG